jgi:hypothetical protein
MFSTNFEVPHNAITNSSVTAFLLRPLYFSRRRILEYDQPMFSLNLRGQFCHQHNETRETVVQCVLNFTFLNIKGEDNSFWTEWQTHRMNIICSLISASMQFEMF